jgi:hypothetical protein
MHPPLFPSTNYIYKYIEITYIPELGSTLGYCIEAWSVTVQTAEDLYATKTLLQRAGQYLKLQCVETSSARLKKADEKYTTNTMSNRA